MNKKMISRAAAALLTLPGVSAVHAQVADGAGAASGEAMGAPAASFSSLGSQFRPVSGSWANALTSYLPSVQGLDMSRAENRSILAPIVKSLEAAKLTVDDVSVRSAAGRQRAAKLVEEARRSAADDDAMSRWGRGAVQASFDGRFSGDPALARRALALYKGKNWAQAFDQARTKAVGIVRTASLWDQTMDVLSYTADEPAEYSREQGRVAARALTTRLDAWHGLHEKIDLSDFEKSAEKRAADDSVKPAKQDSGDEKTHLALIEGWSRSAASDEQVQRVLGGVAKVTLSEKAEITAVRMILSRRLKPGIAADIAVYSRSRAVVDFTLDALERAEDAAQQRIRRERDRDPVQWLSLHYRIGHPYTSRDEDLAQGLHKALLKVRGEYNRRKAIGYPAADQRKPTWLENVFETLSW